MNLLINDNFLLDPEMIRNQLLMSPTWQKNGRSYKGWRSAPYRPDYLKEEFERLLGRQITDWDNQPMNGVGQVTDSTSPRVWHCDAQEYAAMIYLTPDAPLCSGTSLYQHRDTGIRIPATPEEVNQVFEQGHYDGTPFESVATVANIFNRLCIFSARHIHAAGHYFGKEIVPEGQYLKNLDQGRLTWLFFFNCN